MADQRLWIQHFPDFAACSEPPVLRLMEEAQVVSLPAETAVFRTGNSCSNYLLVLAGSVVVRIITASGRAALLYRVRPGNACILTTSCLLGRNDYPVEGVTEQATTALAVPSPVFHEALDHSTFFRNFVFCEFAQRLSGVIARMEELLVGDIDGMLAKALLSTGSQGPVNKTHQELAVDIGSAREVVSRHLKRFEDRGWVRLGRGTVAIVDGAGLRKLAAEQSGGEG